VLVLQFFSLWFWKHSLTFKVSCPMLLFINNFYRFRWWHCNHFAIPNIDTSFISDLFQLNSSSWFFFHYNLALFDEITVVNEKYEVQYIHFTNYNFKGQWTMQYLHGGMATWFTFTCQSFYTNTSWCLYFVHLSNNYPVLVITWWTTCLFLPFASLFVWKLQKWWYDFKNYP
jgi:hypothetical protein